MQNRRQFTKHAFSTIIGATLVVPLLTACGSSNSDSPPPKKDTTTDTGGGATCSQGATSTYTNPGHSHTTVQLTPQQLSDRIEGTYVLMGGSHNHSFELLTADYDQLLSSQTLFKMDLEGHGHILQISCS